MTCTQSSMGILSSYSHFHIKKKHYPVVEYDRIYVCECIVAFVCVCVCVCFPASLSVCVFAVVLSGHLLLELLIPPVLCPCCALICWYTWSVISLYAYSACWREILTLSKHRSLLLNISRAFTYQVSNIKGKFINTFTSVMWQLYSPWTLIGRRGT